MNKRMFRADAEIQKELATIIKTELKDPRLNDEIISVSWVKTSSDFEHCKAGISIYNPNQEERKEILKLLKKSSGFIKKTLATNLNLRAVPEIIFELDEGSFYEDQITEILSNLNIPKESVCDESNYKND